MYRKIIVVLDGSESAEAVLPHARSVSGKGTEIVMVRPTSLCIASGKLTITQEPVKCFQGENDG
jgi:nucleotide-binding universal stress UspA family protein